MCFRWGAQLLHFHEFTFLLDLLLYFVLLLTVVPDWFKVDWLCDLLYLFKKFLFFVGFFFFLLLEFFFKFNKLRLQIGPNSRYKLFVHLFELLFLILSTLDRRFHPFFRLLTSYCRFHFPARLIKLRVDLLLSLGLLFNQLSLQRRVLKSQTPQFVFLCHLFEFILAFFDFQPKVYRWKNVLKWISLRSFSVGLSKSVLLPWWSKRW